MSELNAASFEALLVGEDLKGGRRRQKLRKTGLSSQLVLSTNQKARNPSIT
jgi:hypothetical protein